MEENIEAKSEVEQELRIKQSSPGKGTPRKGEKTWSGNALWTKQQKIPGKVSRDSNQPKNLSN